MSYTKPWAELSRDEMGACIQGLIEEYKKYDGRKSLYIENLELYERRSLGGLGAHAYAKPLARGVVHDNDRLGLIRSAVEHAVASIYAPQKPKPQFQTLGATWEARRRAYRLDRIVEGVLNQRQGRYVNVWAFVLDGSTDAALQGTACIKVTADREQMRIVHELVPHPFIFTDPNEGRDPRSWFQHWHMPRASALELWGKEGSIASAIRSAPRFEWHLPRGMDLTDTDQIEVNYAWSMPIGPEKPGKAAVVIGGKVVELDDWDAPMPPFVFLHWSPARESPWGTGIGVEGGEMAREISDLDLRIIHRARHGGVKFIFHRPGTNPDDLVRNDAVVAVEVDPQEDYPQPVMLPTFTEADLNYRDSKIRDYWDMLGLSQVSAAARREQNITSAIGQITLNDTKAGRQLPKAQRLENAYVDLAHQYVWRLRELGQDDPDFAVTWPGKTMLRQVKWNDADVDDDQLSVSVAPASMLPHDPAGRQEMVQRLYEGRLISQETAKSLINWPDLDRELDIANAESEYVDSLIAAYLDADPDDWTQADYEAPEGFISNKVGALQRFTSAWFRARTDSRALPPEEREKAEFNIGLLHNYITQLLALVKNEVAPPATSDQLAPAEGQVVTAAPAGAAPPEVAA